jgi:alcohol dehydrogenase YqhD (iron-dependent ADH family)
VDPTVKFTVPVDPTVKFTVPVDPTVKFTVPVDPTVHFTEPEFSGFYDIQLFSKLICSFFSNCVTQCLKILDSWKLVF